MTTFNHRAILGPHGTGVIVPYGAFLSSDYYQLNDSNDAIAWKFSIPISGTITSIGFYVANIVGSPPPYNFGLVSISNETGVPTGTPYGGSSLVEFTPDSVGWYWASITASASAGDLVAIHIYPVMDNYPNTSNYISICNPDLLIYDYSIIPSKGIFTTAWATFGGGFSTFAIRYNDGKVYGFPASDFPNTVITSVTTPNEVGCKFTVPFDVNCIGPSISVYNTNATQKALKITLYDNNDTELRSITYLDSNEFFITNTTFGGTKRDIMWDSPIALAPNVTYRLTFQNLSSVSGIGLLGIQFPEVESKTNNIFNSFAEWSSTVRTNSGVWTDNNLAIYEMGVIIDSFTVATSGVTITNLGGSYAYVG